MNAQSSFDPATFMDSTVDDAFTRRPPLPQGDYLGVIGEMQAKSGISGERSKHPGKPWQALNIPIEIDLTDSVNAVAREAVGQDKVVVFHFVGLDLTDSGMIDQGPGKNRGLRAYREALGQNVPGQRWSPRNMQGCMIKVRIKHEDYEGEPQERVDAVAKP